MKKAIFMMAVAGAFVFNACKSDAAKATEENTTTTKAAEPAAETETASIVGTWKMSDVDLGMEVPKGKEKVIEDMKKQMIAETVYTFNEDGSMTYKNPMVVPISATYTLNGTQLMVTNPTTKKTDTMTVDELSANKLVLSSEQGNHKAVMTFTK